jgi:signal transduction histidine kinase
LDNTTPYKPRIRRIGFMLSSLSVVASLILLGILAYTWTVTSQIALNDQAGNLYVAQLSKTISDWSMYSGSATVVSLHDPHVDYPARMREFGARLARDFSDLHRLSAKDPRRISAVQTLNELVESEKTYVQDQEMDFFSMLNISSTNSYFPKYLEILKIRNLVPEILSAQCKILDEERAAEDAIAQRLKSILIVNLVGTILVAIALLALVSRLIFKRIQIVLANARALKQRDNDLTDLSGDDEFAYINRILKECANQLRQSEQFRQSIVEMVAHDVRSPVMGAQIYLDLLVSSLEETQHKLAAVFASCSEKLDGVILSANQLLTKLTGNAKRDDYVAEQTNNVDSKKRAVASNRTDPANKPHSWRASVFLRVLLIVGVPSLLQLTVFVYIGNQLHQLEQIVAQERKICDIKADSTIVETDLLTSGMYHAAYIWASNKEYEDLCHETYKKAMGHLENLQRLSQGDPEWSQFSELTKESATTRMQELQAINPGARATALIKAFSEVAETRRSLPTSRKARLLGARLLERDSTRLSELILRQSRTAGRLTTIFFILPALDLLLLILLLLGLTAHIDRRLNAVVRNVIKLGRGDAIDYALDGADEFAELDELIFEAKQVLSEAASKRRMVVSQINQELRLPVKEIITTFETRDDKIDIETLKGVSQDNSNRLNQIINMLGQVLILLDDLTMVEGLHSGKIALRHDFCYIREIAELAVETTKALAEEKKITIVNQCGSELVRGDKARFRQLLVNYIVNAIKFSPANSRIILSDVRIDSRVIVSVTDFGQGMDEVTKHKIFDKYFQGNTMEKGSGFGIGLAICSLVADAHGWNLSVDSSPGEGSTFRVEIPIVTSSQ